MKIKYNSSADIGCRSNTLADVNYDIISVEQQDLVTPGSTVDSTVDDRSITTHMGAAYDKHYDIAIIETIPGCLTSDGVLQSLDACAEVTYNSRVNRVSNGTARIEYRQNQLTKQISLNVTRATSSTTIVQNGYIASSLAKHCSDAVDNAINGLTPSISKAIYATYHHASSTYTRNADCWIDGIDVTCIAVWNSTYAGKFGPTAITPRHVIFAEHVSWAFPNGTTLRFLSSDNTTVITRTISSSAQVGSSDFRIGKLDSDLPGTITPCKVLPTTAINYLPSLAEHSIPIIVINQDREAFIADYSLNVGYDKAVFASPDDATRLSFFEQTISGDSGLPRLVIVNSQLVLVSTATSPSYGPNIISLHGNINSVLTSLGGGYQLTDISLTGFTDFS